MCVLCVCMCYHLYHGEAGTSLACLMMWLMATPLLLTQQRLAKNTVKIDIVELPYFCVYNHLYVPLWKKSHHSIDTSVKYIFMKRNQTEYFLFITTSALVCVQHEQRSSDKINAPLCGCELWKPFTNRLNNYLAMK